MMSHLIVYNCGSYLIFVVNFIHNAFYFPSPLHLNQNLDSYRVWGLVGVADMYIINNRGGFNIAESSLTKI